MVVEHKIIGGAVEEIRILLPHTGQGRLVNPAGALRGLYLRGRREPQALQKSSVRRLHADANVRALAVHTQDLSLHCQEGCLLSRLLVGLENGLRLHKAPLLDKALLLRHRVIVIISHHLGVLREAAGQDAGVIYIGHRGDRALNRLHESQIPGQCVHIRGGLLCQIFRRTAVYHENHHFIHVHISFSLLLYAL